METQTGWYWHRANPDMVTHWDGSRWGRTTERAGIGKAPVFHSESGKTLSNTGEADVPPDRLPSLKLQGAPGPGGSSRTRSRESAVSPQNSWPRAIGGFVVLIVIGIWIFNAIQQGTGPSSTEAGVVCEKFVKSRLKAPSTATFSGTSSSASGAGYTVTTTVDSENSFGARLRSTWTCDVSWSQADEKWLLTAISQK